MTKYLDLRNVSDRLVELYVLTGRLCRRRWGWWSFSRHLNAEALRKELVEAKNEASMAFEELLDLLDDTLRRQAERAKMSNQKNHNAKQDQHNCMAARIVL